MFFRSIQSFESGKWKRENEWENVIFNSHWASRCIKARCIYLFGDWKEKNENKNGGIKYLSWGDLNWCGNSEKKGIKCIKRHMEWSLKKWKSNFLQLFTELFRIHSINNFFKNKQTILHFIHILAIWWNSHNFQRKWPFHIIVITRVTFKYSYSKHPKHDVAERRNMVKTTMNNYFENKCSQVLWQ